MKQTEFDLLIVGGGMVGASLAIALENSELTIGLIETHPLKSNSQPSYDDRGIALSYGSQRIFDSMGLWSDIAAYATPIKQIHISDRGRFGVTRLSADAEHVPALGQVLLARELGFQLNQRLQQQANLTLLCPAQVEKLNQHTDAVELTLNTGQHYSAKLVVAADGKNSTIRQLLGIGSWQQQYQQTALTANISTDKKHQGWAYERFTDTGPLALLPMSENRSSLVWTVKTGEEKALLALSDADFLQRLQQRFGYRAGRFVRVGQRHSHPLTLMQADMPIQHRIVFIGNAAHSLHPIAGQGFNLGLRDVAVLAELLHNEHDDCGNMQILHCYQQWREQDQDHVVKATDNLVKLFSNDIKMLGHLRGAGLAIMDNLPFAKHWLAQKSMGLGQKQPRLGRGMQL
ncbi:2-octaprenyl-6-methoxyphenyl hydroxylase [Methylophaga thiooxydans]|uniref:2-polyprenyl-6-methoxyphenol 4-hydroxylase n=1 Tax=Methylophaga thiooxydans DMS010 TaxID=637616 RepID=C0N6Z8_9GAMM|nr:2-octaprenyl-6-methoxyphenyl hydroxylase [Methylophaga thiooxydans]EEF79343.1 2-polyprenyl-6-methoxyphenol 4-hydroxylase [Methylophaga thiooxydans DMS010]